MSSTAAGDPSLRVGLKGVSVLVVDDDADNRELVTLLLRSNGAEVRAVSSAAEALLQLADRAPAILLSDLGMPDLDGFELIRRVRATLGQTGARLPAIAVSAYAREHVAERAIAAGFDAFLLKPMETARLIRTMLQVIAARS